MNLANHPRATLLASLLAGLALWMAFPPVDWPWLAWLAPLPWLWLAKLERLPGRRAYLAIWFGGFVHWLLMLQGIRLAHPALYAGWLALAAYVAVYIPLSVGLTRVAVHRAGWPLALAAPIVWTGLELLKGHLLTGFSMGLLGHTQANFPWLLQTADFAGAYAVSFLVMLVAATIADVAFAVWPQWLVQLSPDKPPQPAAHSPSLAAAICLVLLVGAGLYGQFRLREPKPDESRGQLRAALIQGSLDTAFDSSEEEYKARVNRTFQQYGEVTRSALAQQEGIQLVLWPESMFAIFEVLGVDLAEPPGGGSAEEYRASLKAHQQSFLRNAKDAATLLNPSRHSSSTPSPTGEPVWFLCGSTTLDYSTLPIKVYNSALLIDGDGRIADRYYKTHPVMFGEYIPFGEMFPWIYSLTPMSGGLSIGEGPRTFDVAGLRLCPNICFENTVPHLIRRQVAELTAQGKPPDLLVNDSNDGWFKGSSMLDLHLRCAVFRCVENRKPMLVAANTGFSAWIDGNGVIREQGPRRQPKAIVVDARPDGRHSLYTAWGDMPAGICLLLCAGLAFWGWRSPKTASERSTDGAVTE
jgi:apolipoprotein N-acyltransferase